MKKRRVKVFAALVVTAIVVAAALLVLWPRADAALRGEPRIEWKNTAIADLTRRTADAASIESQLASSKPIYGEPGDYDAWIGDRVIFMKDGEWIAYANICRKEDIRIPDLFIGRGSDGKWYYSTYHFCIRMFALLIKEQPESLSEFVDAYYLKEFDGLSDECLNRTWPIKGDPSVVVLR